VVPEILKDHFPVFFEALNRYYSIAFQKTGISYLQVKLKFIIFLAETS